MSRAYRANGAYVGMKKRRIAIGTALGCLCCLLCLPLAACGGGEAEVTYAQGDTQIFRTDSVDKIDKEDVRVSVPRWNGAITPAADELTLTADFLHSDVVTVHYDGAAIGTFTVTFAGEMLLDFDDGVALAEDDDGKPLGFGGSLAAQTKNRLGGGGYGAGVNFNGNMDVSRAMRDLDLTGIDEIYYYVYLDDTVWTCDNVAAGEVTIMTALSRVRPAGWRATVLTEVGWNKWMLFRADRQAADTTTPVTWTFGAYDVSWGVPANMQGFKGNVICFDEIFWLPDA